MNRSFLLLLLLNICTVILAVRLADAKDDMLSPKKRSVLLSVNLFFLSAFLLHEGLMKGAYLLFHSMSHVLCIFAWFFVASYLVLAIGRKNKGMPFLIMALSMVLTMTAVATWAKGSSGTEDPIKGIFALHLFSAVLAYASLALSFAAALLYLYLNKQLKKGSHVPNKYPSLDLLELVVYRGIILGLPLLTLALASGILWSQQVYGLHWHSDPKLYVSLITWVLYSLIIYFHYVSSIRGKRLITFSIIAFSIVIVIFLWTRT